MKIRYTSDKSGCFGETNEVVNIPNKLLTNKTQEEINQTLKNFISSLDVVNVLIISKFQKKLLRQWNVIMIVCGKKFYWIQYHKNCILIVI